MYIRIVREAVMPPVSSTRWPVCVCAVCHASAAYVLDVWFGYMYVEQMVHSVAMWALCW
jgi:hypothetical protein